MPDESLGSMWLVIALNWNSRFMYIHYIPFFLYIVWYAHMNLNFGIALELSLPSP